jgi:hypothetical protein
MTHLTYVDQSADNLRLNLVEGIVDKKLLNVLSTGGVDLSYGRIEAGIIGASHYLEFTRPDGSIAFTEVFACIDVASSNQVLSEKLQNVASLNKEFGDINYDFSSCKLNWKEGKEKYNELLGLVHSDHDDLHIGLQFRFPSLEKGDFSPLTLVYVKADPKNLCVEVETLHAYPNEDALVFTKTKFVN